MEKYWTLIHPWLWSIGILLGVIVLTLIGHWLLYPIAARVARKTGRPLNDYVVRRTRAPSRLLLPLLVVSGALPELPLPVQLSQLCERLVAMGMIAALAWMVIAVLDVIEDLVTARYRTDVEDNLAARRVQTQATLLRRIAGSVVFLIAAALVLMKIPSIHHLGVSLLASAGLAGLVVGMAARPTLSNLLAGIQLALTEPIRIDDVVIVEGEYGRIEEIAATYVVVQVWDLRSLIVPLSYFIEHPFQNWTRTSADLIGTVFVHVDYSLPIEPVREELHRILQTSDLWDGKVWNLQVTDATDRTVELRAMMTSSSSSRAWDLRCYVREHLLTFLQERYPDSLPRVRAEVQNRPLRGKPEAQTA